MLTSENNNGNELMHQTPQPVVFTGLIRLRASPFPKLQGTEYVLNVTATDDNASGGPHPLSSIAQVVVKIDDVNNNKPVFQKVNI